MSELVREALRHYDRRAWWDEVNAHGRYVPKSVTFAKWMWSDWSTNPAGCPIFGVLCV